MKTLKQILEVYSPKSADEKRFVKKHITIKHADVNGNGDDVFSGAAVKEIDRKKTRKGYNNADSEAVYEGAFIKGVKRVIAGKKNPSDVRDAHLAKSASSSDPKVKEKEGRRYDKVQSVISKEEVEQVDELKKSTLRSYVDKAKAENLPGKGGNRGVALLTPGTRDKGVHKAVDRMKKMKEEVDVNEVLKVSAGAGEWIKDFEASDNPKFAGKSKEQRKQQALAAYYAAKRAGKD